MHSTLIFVLLVTLIGFFSSVEALKDHSHLVKFKRQNPDKSKYPPVLKTPPKSSLPQDWIDALETLQKAGKIPDIPVSTSSDDGITYPKSLKMSQKEICNWSITGCFGQNDIHEAADGVWTISFDDGPTASSPDLYDFLHSHNQAGTHFMIGSQIVAYMENAKHALQTQQQLAVHTWSHSLQTTKDNYEVLGELGWTMQIIYDLSGRVPKYWRPPQGDVDNRVRAIAEGVFNLTTVMWDAECNDWCIGDDGKSACPGETPGKSKKSVKQAINKALKKPKSPGVMILEHELNKYTVGFFTSYYPRLAGLGWKPLSVPEQFGVNWYHNAANNDDVPVNTTSMLYSTVSAAVSKANGNGNNSNNLNKVASPGSKDGTATNPPSSLAKNASSKAHSSIAVFTLTIVSVAVMLSATVF